MKKVIEMAHYLLSEYLTNNDITIDMTLGNGNDTYFLCSISKHVYGFDIQNQAIEKSKEKLACFNNYTLIHDSHEFVDKYIDFKVKGIIYNLGYLPSGDKKITTKESSTLISIKKALNLLSIDGIIVIVCYPGHEEGKNEAISLVNYLCLLNQKEYDILKYEFINQVNNPPFLLAIRKKI